MLQYNIINEELLERKVAAPVLKTEINGRGNWLRWPRDTLYPLKLTLTSPTSGGRSVGIVRWRTTAREFICCSYKSQRSETFPNSPRGACTIVWVLRIKGIYFYYGATNLWNSVSRAPFFRIMLLANSFNEDTHYCSTLNCLSYKKFLDVCWIKTLWCIFYKIPVFQSESL
jgi:hypothetical protein